MVRAFIAIDLERDIINEIVKIQNLIRKKTLFSGKLTESENLHLTLKFLGEASEEKLEEVKKRLKNIKLKSFDCEIADIGFFSKTFPKIIWIKLNGKEIWDLQKLSRYGRRLWFLFL